MSNLIEDSALRDKVRVFEDRKDAGIALAARLEKYRGSDSIVFAIPSGGVPVAKEIASSLACPLELIVVRKIQIPYNTEAGFGAMDPDGKVIFNEGLLNRLGLAEDEIRDQTKKTLDVIKRRDELFRGKRAIPSLRGKTVIVVDDGIASGYTMLVAVRFLKRKMAAKIVAAVPTGSRNTVDFIRPEVDELVCLNVRSGFSFAVAEAYRKWYDLDDDEVLSLL